jgi:hypothetical protein
MTLFLICESRASKFLQKSRSIRPRPLILGPVAAARCMCSPPLPGQFMVHGLNPSLREVSTPSSPLFSSEPCFGAAPDGLDGSNSGFGLAVDDAGFGAGACTTFVDVDPCSSPGGPKLNDVCTPDDPRITLCTLCRIKMIFLRTLHWSRPRRARWFKQRIRIGC